MRQAVAAWVLAVLAGAAPAAAQEQPLRARGVPPVAGVDSFRAPHGRVLAGITPGGEVALALAPYERPQWYGPRYGVREWVDPDTMLAWLERVVPGADSTVLGTGALRLVLPSGRAEKQGTGWFGLRLCRGGGGSANHQTFAHYLPLLELLRRTAAAARAARPAAAPTEEAPWWEHAVACPAEPLGPAPLAHDSAAPPLVAHFVVGVDGRPEPVTLAALPGTPRERVEALRRALPEWRFAPATRGDRPVRQVVFTLVSPLAPTLAPERGRRGYRVSLTPDGLVEVRAPGPRERGRGGLPQRAFFTPAEVTAWVDAVRARRFPAFLGGPPTRGPARRSTMLAEIASIAGHQRLRVYLGQCGAAASGPSDSTLVPALERAAAAARESPPRLPAAGVYAPDEVDCPAVPDTANPAPRARPGESAELHAAFVVDTAGRAEPGSLRVMPGSDPALADAFRAVLPRWRFLPATRLGRPVRQLVVLPVVFGRDGRGTIDLR